MLVIIIEVTVISTGTDGAVGLEVTTTQPCDLTASSPPSKSSKRNRCFVCRKKVGLTGKINNVYTMM